jgi:Na+-transporting methylmalonyl-CoA/oxaloacetate decarboxylase gamma subunit
VATAAAITVVGMTLLFLTLVFFYGLMVFITKVLKDPPAALEHQAGEARQEPKGQEAMLRAAAIAVALARAESELGSGRAQTPNEGARPDVSPTSAWWTLHHQRRLRSDPEARRMP